MLDQQRLVLFTAIEDLPDRDPDVATIIANVWLQRLAPAPVEQQGDGCNARRLAPTVASDPRQYLYAQFGVGTRQRTQICWCFSHLAWGCPSFSLSTIICPFGAASVSPDPSAGTKTASVAFTPSA
jgi:hypothetical protein